MRSTGTGRAEGFAEIFMLYCGHDSDLSHKSVKYFKELENRLRGYAATGWSTDSDDE